MTTTHERIKTVLLAVLIIGAVFMAYSTWFYDNPMGDNMLSVLIGGNVSGVRGDYQMQSYAAGQSEIGPMRISVKNEYGRFGAEYSPSAVENMYDLTRGLMAEALSVQSGNWRRVNEEYWRTSLGYESVLYDYQGLVRADTVTQWLWGGQNEAGNIKGRYVLLTVNPKNEKTFIVIKNPYTGEVYASETQVDKATALGVIDGISGESHNLAFELAGTDYEKLVPESFVKDGYKPRVIGGFNAMEYFSTEQRANFLKSFGFAPYSVSEHVESGGTRVYIEEDATVRIENDGFTVYTYTGSDAQAGIFVQSAQQTPSATEVFETARILVSRLAAVAGGEGKMYPQDFRYFSEYNCWVADFGRSVNGIPVDRQDTGYAARVVIRDRRVSEVHFYMRSYQSTERDAKSISKKLATAAVSDVDGECELELRYTDAGQAELEPMWYIKNSEK